MHALDRVFFIDLAGRFIEERGEDIHESAAVLFGELPDPFVAADAGAVVFCPVAAQSGKRAPNDLGIGQVLPDARYDRFIIFKYAFNV